LRENLTSNGALERQNAQPNSIAEDFARFGLDIWTEADRERNGNAHRRLVARLGGLSQLDRLE
jgi:hypothetical protein